VCTKRCQNSDMAWESGLSVLWAVMTPPSRAGRRLEAQGESRK
jgi:hypothetical protein